MTYRAFAKRNIGLVTVRVALSCPALKDGDPHLELPPNSSGRHSRPSYVSRTLNRISRPKSATVTLTLAGGAALLVAGIGGIAAPATGVNPLIAMGSWPASLTELGGGDQDLVELADVARATDARASRDGGRTGLDAKPAGQAVRARQIHLENVRAALIESTGPRNERPRPWTSCCRPICTG